ncbi:hypothetical protein [Sphingomonas sp.]|uniref:hypothetical protein n=1 Tax=Sphingomonas sp. TaxID=28214 RepID=UPI003D6D0432
MLFTTFGQFVVLLLLFFGGLVLGLGLHPGSRKWRKRLYAESEAYSAYRRKAETQIREGNARIAELERENEALKGPVAAPEALTEPSPEPAPEPATAAEAAEQDADAPADEKPAPRYAYAPALGLALPVAASAAVSAFPPPLAAPEPEPVAEADDLSRLRGVDEPLKERLADLGMTHFADIENLSAEDEMALEKRLDLPAGRIASEQWRDQATLLRTGKAKLHNTRFPDS